MTDSEPHRKPFSVEAILPRLYGFQKDHPGTELHAGGGRITLDQYRRLFSLAGRLLRPGMNILDWGCGQGHYTYALLQAGYRVHAFSLEKKSPFILHLEEDFPDRLVYVQGTLREPTRLTFPDGLFDAVFSVGVLEHVRETGGSVTDSLREIRRILKTGGLFIAYHFPNRTSLIETLARLLSHPAPHRYRFSQNEIPDLCRRCGFAILERRTYGMIPRNLWSKVPPRIHLSSAVASMVNRLDEFLESVLPLLCQNHLFVARAVSPKR